MRSDKLTESNLSPLHVKCTCSTAVSRSVTTDYARAWLSRLGRYSTGSRECSRRLISHGTCMLIFYSLVAFSFLHPSLVPEPPTWRLPDPASDSLWFGEIWMKYPSNTHLLPSFFGQVFLARCHFRIIMAHFCQEAYSKDSKITLDIANRLLTSLEKWHLQLPKQLLPKTIVLPHQLQLQ